MILWEDLVNDVDVLCISVVSLFLMVVFLSFCAHWTSLYDYFCL